MNHVLVVAGKNIKGVVDGETQLPTATLLYPGKRNPAERRSKPCIQRRNGIA
jgi:hypothetical protein